MVINFFRNFFRLVVNEKRFYFSHTTESIAHELRSPIFNIKAFLETMYEYNSTLTEFESLEFLEILNKEILRLTHLIDNLLDLYSLNSKDSLKKDYCDLVDIFSQVLSSYSLVSKSKNVDIFFEVKDSGAEVFGNSDLLGQVIHNLVGNSLKYNFVRKTVCVKSRDFVCINTDDYVKKSYAWISVLDEGTGVLKIGEFLNGYKVISSKIKGTGLGIPIVRKILSYHNSHLSLLTKIKKGSCFSFLLKISR